MRDLPMPGSPLIRTTEPSPAFACSQRRLNNAISSSRPINGVLAARRASNRLPTEFAPKTRQTCTGWSIPAIANGPRSR